MIYVFYALHVLVCLFLILVVLLQQGKGADLSVFGGGSTQTAFGARGAATVLHKLTVASFIVFIITTLGIAYLAGGETGASVMSDVMEERADERTSTDAPAETAGEEGAPADATVPLGEAIDDPAPAAPEAGEAP
ncbi:MAG TPA: preprotein translocase subunit SecG [Thermoanaerobaculia bacterium]|nr:preprotein translocase subunit SecG [Thermoanaerobaculia bacterium]